MAGISTPAIVTAAESAKHRSALAFASFFGKGDGN